jgi:hypothetical protein
MTKDSSSPKLKTSEKMKLFLRKLLTKNVGKKMYVFLILSLLLTDDIKIVRACSLQ